MRYTLSLHKVEILASTPMFHGLGKVELEALAQRTRERHFAQGEALFHEGEECAGLFVLATGTVKIFKTSGSGREIMLAVESAPSSVAEVPLFDGGPYPATVSAITPVTALLIQKQDFQHVCRQHSEVPLKVLAVVGQRLRTLVGIVESVTFGSVRQRLARALIEFRDIAGKDTFSLPVSHQELASRLGTVREVVSRNLSRFQGEGLIRIQSREIKLLNRAGLDSEAETEF